MQPALQDEPRRSGGVWGPSLAETLPKTRKTKICFLLIGPYWPLTVAGTVPVRYGVILSSERVGGRIGSTDTFVGRACRRRVSAVSEDVP